MSKSPDYFQAEIPSADDKRVARIAAGVANLLPWTSRFKQIRPIIPEATRTIAVTDRTIGDHPQLFVTRVVCTNPDFGVDLSERVSNTYLITGLRASEYVARITAETLKKQWEASLKHRLGQGVMGFRQRLSGLLYRFGRVGE